MSHNHPKHSITSLQPPRAATDRPKANILQKLNFQVYFEARGGTVIPDLQRVSANPLLFSTPESSKTFGAQKLPHAKSRRISPWAISHGTWLPAPAPISYLSGILIARYRSMATASKLKMELWVSTSTKQAKKRQL